ncbi:hypothetical protein BVI2075_470003 [Burkholderia vietnamiensis]|nr:hypothetical protein BVI2075_470003 [Burkholderia vietnamiensis]
MIRLERVRAPRASARTAGRVRQRCVAPRVDAVAGPWRTANPRAVTHDPCITLSMATSRAAIDINSRLHAQNATTGLAEAGRVGAPSRHV